VVREGEGRRSYSLSSASADRDPAHLYDRRLFSAEDADSPWPFSDLVEPSPNYVDLWRSHCHSQARPSRIPNPPDPLSFEADDLAVVEKEGSWPTSQRTLLRPAGEGKTGRSPRTPSVVSRSCKLLHLQSADEENGLFASLTRTVSPSARPRPASGGATNFFLASALCAPTGLATSRWRRRAMRPTDICHPIELRAPAPRVFLVRSRHFRSGETPWRIRLHAATTRGPDVSRRPKPLRRIVDTAQLSNPTASYGLENERGRFLPTALLRSSLWHPCRDSRVPHMGLAFARFIGEIGNRQDHRHRRLVKACAASWSGVPSIDRDSS